LNEKEQNLEINNNFSGTEEGTLEEGELLEDEPHIEAERSVRLTITIHYQISEI
jgi:hypothetical protein